MSRRYSSRDTKSLIDKHHENLNRLEVSSLLPSQKENVIQERVIEMLTDGIFAHVVMDALNGTNESSTSDQSQISELIRQLYLFKRTVQQAQTCKTILQDNKERIQQTIQAASLGANVISWLFTSAKKKQISEEACELLENEINEGRYWTLSHEVFSSIVDNNTITAEAGLNDFNACVKEYERNLKRILANKQRNVGLLSDLQSLIKKFNDISTRLAKETNRTEGFKKNIQEAAERVAMGAVLDILKNVPVEEVNRDRKGFRVKALRDAGYMNMADLYTASDYQLSAVYGISEDAAYSIKNAALKFAREAKQNVKIKLSADNQTKEATKLVLELFKYQKYLFALETYNKLNSEYNAQIKSAMADLQMVGDGLFWIFFDESKKEKIKKGFAYLTETIKGEYSKSVNESEGLFKEVSFLTSQGAWEDFKNNSIAYYNVLEEIVPGVLGNDDQLYGLPEDLAREIQEECFFPDGLKCELRRYQEWGVKYILHQERVLLGDEMGLGKTIQAIATMVSLRNTGASHFIVVCPASVVPNWCKEIYTKSKLRVTKIHGTGKISAFQAWLRIGGVAVTTYETTGILEFEDNYKYDLLVVDEAHCLLHNKNTESCRPKMENVASPFWRKLQTFQKTSIEDPLESL